MGEKVDFKLREYQQEASQNIDEIFENKSFAGAVLPTGAGKSFLAIQAILQAGGNDYKNASIDDVINPNEMFYIAPTNEILVQVKRHIAKYVLKLDVNNMEYSDLQKAVTKAFPRLSFMCYQTLSADVKNDKLGEMEPSLVILDEAHRSGAEIWQKAVNELLEATPKKDEVKVLAISATPERDVDGRNMMDEWAKKLGYSQSEIDNEEHLGVNMTLTQAVNDGIVVEPEVVHFDAVLGKSDEYIHLVKMYKNASEGTKIKSELRKSLDIINNDILKIPGFDELSEKEQEEKITEQMVITFAEAVKQGKFNQNGKYIEFIPHNREGIDIFEHMKKHENIVRKVLGDKADTVFSYLTSKQDDLTNSNNLTEFSNSETDPNSNSPKVKVILASDKLNEGVHADGISGSFMGRNISEGNKDNKRKQAILFLQQVGRCVHGVRGDGEEDIRPVIFDLAGNFFKQNRNNPNREEFTEIDLFKLTPSQKEFVKIYNMSLLNLPEKSVITDKVPRLFSVLNVLAEFGFEPNNETITEKTTLESLLNEEPISKCKDEIIKILHEEGLCKPNKNYNIGRIFYEAKKSFWNGTKFFEQYDFMELKEFGIIDTYTETGVKELEQYKSKYNIDKDTGFIQFGATEKFVGFNIYTGTILGIDGRDVEGYLPGEFNEEGFDSAGYNKLGFNKEGKHKITGTIHDEKGFMADGTNILTGTDLDMLGYNIKNIKPEYSYYQDGSKELVGGWDSNGLWHLVTETGEFSGPVGKYREMTMSGKTIKIDVHGFYSNNKKNYLNNDAEIDYNGFYKTGDCMYPEYEDPKRDRAGYDIDGFDRLGFNISGIHRETHINKPPKSKEDETPKRFKAMYSELAKSVCVRIKEMSAVRKREILNLGTDGRFHYKRTDGKEIIRKTNIHNFDKDGINVITREITDIYGFSILDSNPGTRTNNFGFTTKEIPKNIAQKNPRFFYKRQSDGSELNILGTDKYGIDKKGKKHPSLEITSKYLKDYMRDDKPLDKVIEEIAISNKMLIPDARVYLNTCINQAVTLYRICPELAKECREETQIFHNCSAEKVDEFMRKCPGLKSYLKSDVSKYMDELKRLNEQQIENSQTTETDKIRQDTLARQSSAVKHKIEDITKIPGFDEK